MILSPKQLEAIEHARKNNWCQMFWHKPGEGKTRIALACIEASGARNAWIICPRKAIEGWEDEIKECKFTIPYHLISADSLHLIGNGWDQNLSKTFLVVDEMYYFATGDSRRSKHLRPHVLKFPYRVGLSGTIMPANNNETIYWQLANLRLEYHLASSLAEFRALYRESALTAFRVRGKRLKVLNNKPGSLDQIIRQIDSVVHVNFPDNIHRNIRQQIIDCKLTTEQLEAIKQVKTEYQLKLKSGEMLDYKTAMEIMFTVCKITNGWIADQVMPTNKLSRLEAILETLYNSNKQAVIWCHFRNDIEFLKKALGYACLTFRGGETFDSTKWRSGKFPFVLATCASGASVNYFGNVEYAIYYSLPLKLTDLLQSKGRHERKNSTHDGAFYYYLLGAAPSFDKHIFQLLQENKDCEDEIILKMLDTWQ